MMIKLLKLHIFVLVFLVLTVYGNAAEKRMVNGENVYDPATVREEKIKIWNQFNEEYQNKWKVEWNRITGTPHRIYGHNIQIPESITKKDVDKATRKILKKLKGLLQIDPDQLTLSKADFLEPTKSSKSHGTWYIYFTQTYQGIPVLGGSVRLIIRDKKLTTLSSDFYPGINLSPEPIVPEQDAIQIVMKDLPGQQPLMPEDVKLVILPRPLSGVIHYRLAWQITTPILRVSKLLMQENPLGAASNENDKDEKIPVQWSYFVDAETGSIIDRVNLVLNESLAGTVTGMVYPSNPSYDVQAEVPIAGITLTATQGQTNLTMETDSSGQYLFTGLNPGLADLEGHLIGPNVRIYNNETPDPDATHSASVAIPGAHNWNWSPDDPSPNDVETNAYYHVKFIRDWFLRGGPFNVTPVSPWGQSGSYVQAFVRDGYYCSAYAAIGGGTLGFGNGYQSGGCRDHALCADIIYHEYGHLVIQQVYDDAQLSLLSNNEGGAMHEAFADYFAMSITGNPILGYGCFEWRNIDTPDNRYPDDYFNWDVHDDGTIIAGAVWDIRKTLGRDYTDSLAFRALKHVPTSFSEYLGALIEEDDDPLFNSDLTANNNPGDGTPNINLICNAFFDVHGIYHDYCANRTESPVAVITSPSPLKSSLNSFDGSVSVIPIIGTAQGSLFSPLQNFSLEYANEKDLNLWLTAGMTLNGGGTAPVEGGTLGEWNISGIEDGYYLIRLRVTDASNHSSSTIVNVLIDRGLAAGWPQELDRLFIASLAVADLDPAYPGLEVVGRERWGILFAWHSDGTPVSGWPQSVDSWPPTSPAIGDLDDDGELEVVTVGGDKVHVLRKDGAVMTGWPQICSGGMAGEVTPVISDLDQDGKYEVVTATSTGTVCAWRYDGTPLAGWPITLNSGVRSAIAVGDLDRDGYPEIVVGTSNFDFYALRNDGSVLTGWPKRMDMVIASPALGDIDKDGYLEIVVGGQSGIYAWHYDGTPVSGWPQYPGGIISSKSIVLADIDQDGYVEVVLQSSGKIYVWRHDGTALPWSPYVFNCIYCDGAQSPIVGDIDGDGKMEIVAMVASWFLGNSWPQNEEFGGRTVHKLIAINDDGTAVLNWTKYVPSGPSPPLMADIDQDGNTEIIIGGSGVFIWDIPVPYSMDSVEWPAYRHDWRRTGNYSPRLPDLVIESLTHSPANPTAADLITFTAVVKNIGSGAAGASILAFKVGGESTPSIYSVPALPPKQTYAVQRQETLGVAQNYMNTVTVDVNSEVQETNEANNQEIEYYTVSPASNDYEKPQAIILSPTRDSLTDADMLTVTGTATDNIGIASVTVNGVAAVSSDGFAIWSAVVPLNPGNNTLTVIVRDVSGNVVIADSVLVNRQRNLIVNPISVALDSTNNRALVIPTDPTETLKNLLAVDLNTGERTVISGEGVGTGIEFGAPQDVVLDSASNRVLMTDWVLHGVISVDLPTGNRSIISDSTHGTGPYLNGPRNLALDAANNLVLVTDSDWFNPPALIAVELLTGNRSVISSSTTGEGPNFSFPRGVVLDQANHRAFVTDPGSQALYAVDLFNGNRTVISNNAGFGTGPGFSYPNELAFDSARNRVLVVDPNVEAVIAVDLLTGNRVIVSGQSMGTGPRISDSFDIALNTSTGMAFVVDQDLDALVSVDPSTGSRAIVSGMAIGSGSTFRAPSGIAVDSNNERAFVADFGLDALVVVDMINGSRTVISDAATGTGPQFSDPYGIVYDASNNRVLAVDGSLRALLAVDLGNGNRTILSGASTGSGPAFGLPSGLVYDPDSNHAFVTDVDLNAVVAVDLGMGQRTVISNAATGSGELLSRPAGIALHPAGDRVIVGNNATNKLIAVELTTGNRTVISDDTTGIGPTFSSEGYMGDLAIDSTNGRALVAVGVGTLFAVDLVTGNRSIISGPNKGKGIEYGGISHIAFDSVHRTVVVTDSVLEGLTLIEMGSGDRVIISK